VEAQFKGDKTVSDLSFSIDVATNIPALEFEDTLLVRAVQSVLESEGRREAEITVVLVDDDYLRELKKEYFQIDMYTDVIAFRLNPYEENLVEGEIYISVHRAVEQSADYNTTADTELLRLAIHGTLHLLGYEDEEPDQKAEMTRLENQHLKQFHEPLIVQALPVED